MLRHSIGLDGSGLAGGVVVDGGGWATDILAAARETSRRRRSAGPTGFVGELRSYQAEALAWLGFLDAAGLGGCLALDMGLGKTPTMLAHLPRGRGDGPALVIAPAAVVGNWAAEAARFTPGAARRRAPRRDPRRRPTRSRPRSPTPTSSSRPTAPRCATSKRSPRRVGAASSSTRRRRSRTRRATPSQQLRRIPARTRLALTGTPIENGLGDLWAILDFTNPGLVGTRPQFIAQHVAATSESGAARALNGILVFRRTKAEPEIAAELPDQIDELDHCAMTPEQIGLYQAVLDKLVTTSPTRRRGRDRRKGAILAAITALKQICNHPAAYQRRRPAARRTLGQARPARGDRRRGVRRRRAGPGLHPLRRVGRPTRRRTSPTVTGTPVACYHGGLPAPPATA